ncbi:hypothetical protein GCM10010207_87570 [Streptomyces atratus]|nr:hypothetical protein GCM10010207_87570 [Streptomyces atratus]
MELVEVRQEADVARWGMTGSAIELIDGVDPFAVTGAPSSMSRRLYRHADGRTDGASSTQALRQALAGPSLRHQRRVLRRRRPAPDRARRPRPPCPSWPRSVATP